MNRILVKQTTRMGDVLQTSALVHGLRQRYPDAHIALMVRRMGKTIAERNPDVNEVIVYEEDDMFLDMRAQDSDRLLRAYNRAEEHIQKLRAGRYDMAYNCTHSISSAMLLKLAELPNVIGAHLGDDWQFVLRGPWTNYFFTSVFHREYNDLNLCDILRHFQSDAPAQGQLVFEVNDQDRAFVADLLAQHGVKGEDFIVCFQLGASEENKRWSEVHFATLGRMLREHYGARVFLLGIQEEAKLGKVFEEHAPGLAVHLYGKTSIPQVAALLERANLLVTNDTGTMHIAAAVGCPIVLVSVGYVHFRETGPYGPGHCAIEQHREYVGRADLVPGGLEERTSLLPNQVYKAVQYALSPMTNGTVDQAPNEPELEGVDVLRTQFAPDGCLEWYPVLRRPMEQRDLLRMAYRAMWLDHLGALPYPEAERDSLVCLLGYFASPEPLDNTDEKETGGTGVVLTWNQELSHVFAGLAELAGRGIDQTRCLIECLEQRKSMGRAQGMVRQLLALDEEMRVYAEVHGACRPLVLISRFERDNLEGADPRVLAQTTLRIYDACRTRALLTAKKIALIADLWRDVARPG